MVPKAANSTILLLTEGDIFFPSIASPSLNAIPQAANSLKGYSSPGCFGSTIISASGSLSLSTI